jgi:hypothetical protein
MTQQNTQPLHLQLRLQLRNLASLISSPNERKESQLYPQPKARRNVATSVGEITLVKYLESRCATFAARSWPSPSQPYPQPLSSDMTMTLAKISNMR